MGRELSGYASIPLLELCSHVVSLMAVRQQQENELPVSRFDRLTVSRVYRSQQSFSAWGGVCLRMSDVSFSVTCPLQINALLLLLSF